MAETVEGLRCLLAPVIIVGCGETGDLETGSLSVCLCAQLGVGPSAAGVSPPGALRGAVRCSFASHCKVSARLALRVKMEDRTEAGRGECGGGRKVIIVPVGGWAWGPESLFRP